MPKEILVKTVVFDERLYVGRGLVNRWVKRVTLAFETNAKVKAPINKRANTGHGPPGGLKRSVKADVKRIGLRQLVGEVGVTASYAKYVLAGTGAQGRRYIYSTAGWAFKPLVDQMARGRQSGHRAVGLEDFYMRLPINPEYPGGRKRFHLRVHGQRANNFLVEAYNMTARSHRALKPMAPKFVYRV